VNKLNIILIGAGAVALAGMAAAGGKLQDEKRAAAAKTFNLSEADMPMVKSCETAMLHAKFKSGVSEISGCGCIAHEVGARIATGERAFAAESFPTIVSAAVSGDRKGASAAEFERLITAHKLTETRVGVVTEAMMDAVGKCANPDTYFSDEQRAEIAKVEATKKEKSREALDQLVKNGRMTREEADRRLARM